MRNIALGLMAVAAIAVVTPAFAQDVELRTDSGRHEDGLRSRDRGPGARVEIDRPGRAYANCSMRTIRIHRRDGTVVARRERRCD